MKDNGQVYRHSCFRLSDTGNAELLAALHEDNLRYCHAWGKWMVWTGTHWAIDRDNTPLRLTKEIIQTILFEASRTDDDTERKKLTNHARKTEAASRRLAMLTLAQSEEGIPIQPEQFDVNPWLLNCANCTLDLKSCLASGHDRNDFITRCLPVEYHRDGKCPTWISFLDRIFEGKKDLIRFVQKVFGYALTADISEQCFFILHGTGQNGKSTLLNVLLALLGDAYAMQAAPDLLISKKGSHPTELADLRGSRAVVSVETDDGRRLSESLVKQMTGGDRMKARFMRQNFFEFKVTFKLFLATNHKPQIRGTDHAMWRRIRLIPFNVVIPKEEQDRDLDKKLQAELPGILHWAVEGCTAWQQEGLNPPADVLAATDSYRSEMDVLAAFLGECCAVQHNAKATAKELYRAYCTWCEENGERAENQRSFGMRLTERGFEKYRGGKDGNYMWRGIGLLNLTERTEPTEPNFPIDSSKIKSRVEMPFFGSVRSDGSVDDGYVPPFVDPDAQN